MKKLNRNMLRRLIKEELKTLSEGHDQEETSDLTKATLPKLEAIQADLAAVKKIASENNMPARDLGRILGALSEINKLVSRIKTKSGAYGDL